MTEFALDTLSLNSPAPLSERSELSGARALAVHVAVLLCIAGTKLTSFVKCSAYKLTFRFDRVR